MADAVAGILKRPFAEQVAAFRLRLGELVPTRAWDDMAGAAHDRGFMVAGAMKADLLADLAAAVDRSIAGGGTLDDFRRDFRAIVSRHGWHGWTGEGTAAGEAWRTRVIWRTNMATTYAAGRRAQLIEGGFAFWVYRHGGSREPRPEHLAWDGLALPPDHPFWQTHSPPNGWGCSCRIAGARSAAGVRRLGGDPDRALPDGWQRPDPRTGAPKGIDRGWAHAPGASVAETVRTMAEKAVNWDYSVAVAYMRGVPESVRDDFSQGYRRLPSQADAMRAWAGRVASTDSVGSDLPPQRSLGLATTAQLREIERVSGQSLSASLFDFAVDRDAVRHVFGQHGDSLAEAARGQRAVKPSDFGRLARIVDAPDRLVPAGTGAGGVAVLRYEKGFGEERQIALFEVRTGRRRLNLLTMWVEMVPARPRP